MSKTLIDQAIAIEGRDSKAMSGNCWSQNRITYQYLQAASLPRHNALWRSQYRQGISGASVGCSVALNWHIQQVQMKPDSQRPLTETTLETAQRSGGLHRR